MPISNSPLSVEAQAICNKIPFAITDSHHHLWDVANTYRGQKIFLDLGILDNLPKLGYPALVNPPKKNAQTLARERGTKLPSWPIEKTKAVLSRRNEEYGNFQHMWSDYLPSDIMKDYAHAHVNVAATVHVEAGWDEPKVGNVGETNWVYQQAQETGNVVGAAIVGHTDFVSRTYEECEAELIKHKQCPNFVGIRCMASFDTTKRFSSGAPRQHVLTEANFLKNFTLLKKHGLSFDLYCYSYQLKESINLAKRFPDTPIALDHMATPIDYVSKPEVRKEWLEGMTELAKCKNVHAKLSGLMPQLGTQYQYRTWDSYGPTAVEIADGAFGEMLMHTIRLFGPERVFYGSNFPVDKNLARMGELVAGIWICCERSGMNASQLKGVFRDNAAKFYKISLPASKL
ncbi:hypothetical protein SmJEL517_g04061 [Synchytrium microbalum]|uniref:Amidohydrolase-related domain-containing protein n=1 Tax=Synchytrium microbalum TaxID=1806994 RepID=A0A507C5T2_9FUNG|nr:uncharacterized protein SmJEL517_g04061 [Synchytrium microbalum]TPX32903.1 hypothetical protein SmJEL517_g04061 [Synchytrium microbalum]